MLARVHPPDYAAGRSVKGRQLHEKFFSLLDRLPLPVAVHRLFTGTGRHDDALWLKRRPLDARPTCIFVTLERHGGLAPHALHHLRAWHDAGWQTAVVIITDAPERPIDLDQLAFADAVLLRGNSGYDFGAWGGAIRRLWPDLRRLPVLATVNDSVFGPLRAFPAMLARVEALDADVIGLTESEEIWPHFQSYVTFFKPSAMRSHAFRRFWFTLRPGDRAFVIRHYETKLLSIMRRAGLRCVALFPLPGGAAGNPTLQAWRTLVGMGFPYIKVELLRRNPFGSDLTGWRSLLEEEGYDPALAESYLRTLPDAIPLD